MKAAADEPDDKPDAEVVRAAAAAEEEEDDEEEADADAEACDKDGYPDLPTALPDPAPAPPAELRR